MDRRAAQSAPINRLRVHDVPLDTEAANTAARAKRALDVSVACAHIAAALERTDTPHAVVSSDERDVSRIAEYLGIELNVVAV